jgi:hypothetical protein
VQRPMKALLAGDGFAMPDASPRGIHRLINSAPRKRAKMARCCVSETQRADFLERTGKNSVLVEANKPVALALAIKNLSALHFSIPSSRDQWLRPVGVLHSVPEEH